MAWQLNRGSIYQDVYEKRIDKRPVDTLAKLQEAYLEDEHLVFPSEQTRVAALRDGVFLLRIPDDFQVRDCDLFASNFFKGPAIAPTVHFANSQRKPSTIPCWVFTNESTRSSNSCWNDASGKPTTQRKSSRPANS